MGRRDAACDELEPGRMGTRTLALEQPTGDKRTVTATDRHQTGERHRPSAHETARHLGDDGRALVAALCNVREPVLIANTAGVVVFANEAMEELLGHPPGGLTGFALRNMLSEASAHEALHYAARATTQTPHEFCALLHHACGTDLERRMRVTPVVEDGGGARHLVLSGGEPTRPERIVTPPSKPELASAATAPGRDRSREVGEAADGRVLVDAQQAFALAARLAGELAHDLNNELAVLLNYSFVLLRKLDDRSPLADHLSELKEAAWRASRLSQGLFQFGRRHDTDAERVDLAEALLRLEPLLETALEGQRELDLRVDASPPRLRLPLGRIEQLLMRAAVLARDLPQELGPLQVQLSDVRTDGQPQLALTIAPAPATASPSELQSRAREGVVTDRIRQGLERFGVSIHTVDLGNDTLSIELRVPL